MKVKTFWLILLKIIGLILVLRMVNVIIHSITAVSTIAMWSDGHQIHIIGFVLSVILAYGFVLWLFLFKTSWLVRKLRLENGFETDKVEINTQLSHILLIAIIVIGAVMIVNNLPQLCREIFIFFQERSMWIENSATRQVIPYFIKVFLGCLLLTYSKPITSFIDKQISKKEKESE